MPSHTPGGRGRPAGHRGRTAQGVEHPDGARVRPSSRPKAVEALLLVGGCCGCLDGGEVVRGGGPAPRWCPPARWCVVVVRGVP